MSTKTEVENIKVSGAEKVLAAVLAVFMLIGGVWAYGQIGKISEDTYSDTYMGPVHRAVDLSSEDRDALSEESKARTQSWRATAAVNRAKKQVTFAGDAYRTEIDAGLSGARELAAYREAQASLREARAVRNEADSRLDALRPAADRARDNRSSARAEAKAEQERDDRWVAVLRIALIAAMLGIATWSLSVCRRRRSRLVPIALAGIVAGSLLAAWMAIDYGTTFGVFREIGPLVISLIGILLTSVAFVALQRYLAKKIPARRVRRKECPFCGYPAHGGDHCEGCGRRIVGECSTCQRPRRISTPHCGNCGAT